MCVKKLTEKLKSGHEQACKWRSNPTPGKQDVKELPINRIAMEL